MKGILFKPDMIQAIIEGRKTVTRRAEAGLREINQEPDKWTCIGRDYEEGFEDYFVFRARPEIRLVKPRYQVGETVYIKEKALYWDGGAGGCSNIAYQDDPEIPQLLEDNNRLLITRETENILAGEPVVGKWQWKSPLFMAEEDARYFLEITDVRAERLQEISSYDIEREGLPYKINRDDTHETHDSEIAIEWFRNIWNSINKEKWESNPWVFVYTFRNKEGK